MFEYLNSLKKPELRRFEVFIRSPYFNTYKTIISLLEYLKSAYPNINKKDVTALKISLVVYSEEKVNALKIRKLCSDFKKLFEKFLHHEFIEKRTLIIDSNYLEYLNERDMLELYYNNLNEANSLIEKEKVKNEEYYLRKYKLSIITATDNINNRDVMDYSRFNEGLKNIDYHFIALKMWSIINAYFLNRNNKTILIQSNNFEKAVIEFIESRKNDFAKDHPYIYFLYLSHKMFSTYEDKYYNLLVKYFKNNREKLKGSITISYFSYHYYYLMTKMRYFDKNYATYQNKLYKLFIQTFNKKEEYKNFLNKGLMQNSIYITVASTYLQEGDKDNAIVFINKFKKNLQKDVREDNYNFSMGLYHYYNNEPQKAILYYNKISEKSIVLKFNRRAALLRIYFELDDMISLNNEMVNMYQFSYRNKEAEKLYKYTILKYLKYLRSLIRLKSLKSTGKKNLRYEKNILRKQIENENKSIYQKIWFIKMVDSI